MLEDGYSERQTWRAGFRATHLKILLSETMASMLLPPLCNHQTPSPLRNRVAEQIRKAAPSFKGLLLVFFNPGRIKMMMPSINVDLNLFKKTVCNHFLSGQFQHVFACTFLVSPRRRSALLDCVEG